METPQTSSPPIFVGAGISRLTFARLVWSGAFLKMGPPVTLRMLYAQNLFHDSRSYISQKLTARMASSVLGPWRQCHSETESQLGEQEQGMPCFAHEHTGSPAIRAESADVPVH